MKTQRLIDMHVHTDNSPDGVHSPMYICENAMQKHLGAVAFTDHCEVDKFFSEKYNNIAFHSFFECTKAKHAFEGQILVLIGIELGQPLSNPELTKKIVNAHSYDFVLGSVHTPKGMNMDIKEIPYDELDVYKFMGDYFDELAELANCDYCDCIGHITAPMRRIEGKYGIDFDYGKVQKQLDNLLREVARNDKAIEINTSGLRQDMKKTMPQESIIQRYRELGGKHLTVGSDAHTASDVGAGLEEGIMIAKRCGFKKLTFYQQREPMEIEILL